METRKVIALLEDEFIFIGETLEVCKKRNYYTSIVYNLKLKNEILDLINFVANYKNVTCEVLVDYEQFTVAYYLENFKKNFNSDEIRLAQELIKIIEKVILKMRKEEINK